MKVGAWGSQEQGNGCIQGPGTQQQRPDMLLRGFQLILQFQEEGGCDRKAGINLGLLSKSSLFSNSDAD